MALHETALFYTKLENNNVRCKLCPNNCFIKPGNRGNCRVRENKDGKCKPILYTLV